MPPINEREIEWTETEHGETRIRRRHLSDEASADGDPELGCSLYELPPGRRSWPYHYHTGNAEALYVLSGSGTVRLAGETHSVEAGDYVPFPPGETGAHGLRNDGDEPLRFLMVSTMRDPDVTVYPDSEKFGVYTGSPPGGREGRDVEGYYPIDADVGYWTDED